jgi:chromosome segregation ATPase
MSQKDLAMIFSKLAEFEDERTDEEFFAHIADDFKPPLFSSEESHLEAQFHDFFRSLVDDGPTRETALRSFFEEKLKSFKDSSAQLALSISECRAAYREKDLSTSEKLRLEQEIDAFNSTSTEKSAECRDLQARFKETEQILSNLREEEQKKTSELQIKYEESVANVWKHVQDEEDLVVSKETANTEMKLKIAQFKEHIKARKDHLTTLKRSKDIERQLSVARKAQHDALEQQRMLKIKSYNAHIAQLKETETELTEQLKAYEEKAESFQKSIQETGPVFKQFGEKALSMEVDLQTLNKEVEEKKAQLESKQQKLERFQNHVSSLEARLKEALEDNSLDLQSKALQRRRVELVKELKDLEAAQARASASASSSALAAEEGASERQKSKEQEGTVALSPLDLSQTSSSSQAQSPNGSGSGCPPSSSSKSPSGGGIGLGTVVGGETPTASPKTSAKNKYY